MSSTLRFGCLLLSLGTVCGCARNVTLPPDKLSAHNWPQWSVRPIPPTLTQAEADAQTLGRGTTAVPPANQPAGLAASPVDTRDVPQAGTPLPSTNPPAPAALPPPPALMTGGWEKAGRDDQAHDQNLETARQRWHDLFGLHLGLSKRVKSSDKGTILDGGFHLGMRKYLTPSLGIEMRLVLDRGICWSRSATAISKPVIEARRMKPKPGPI